MSRIAKWTLLASVLVLLVPVVAGASTARLMGLGVQSDFVKDYTNIYTYPSCLPNVGNLVFGELGQVTDFNDIDDQYYTTEDRSVGAVLGNLFDGRFGSIGFALREFTPALGTNFQPVIWEFTGYDYMFGTGFATFAPFIDPNFNASEAFDLMWGKKFDKLSVGLRVNRSLYKQTRTDVPDVEGFSNVERNVTGFGGGIGFDMTDKAMLEAAFLYQSRTFSDPSGTGGLPGTLSEDGSGAYLASARLMWQWKPDVMLVPMGRLYSFDLSESFAGDDPATSFSTDLKQSGWQVGAAGNWTLNQNDLFVLGLSFGQNIQKSKTTGDEFTDTESLMPSMFAALETHVNPWLTLRFGAQKGVFYNFKAEDQAVDPTSELTTYVSPFQFFLGTGVKLGTLQLDATLAQDFFHNPASYVTNESNDFSPLFPRVTATYSF